MEIFTAAGFYALMQVIMIDLVLAGDNAIVIGLAAVASVAALGAALWIIISISRGISSTKLQGLWRLSSWVDKMPSHASLTAPVEPGSAKI